MTTATMATVPSSEGKAPPDSFVRISRISCSACRQRKLRCDRVMPCSTCVRRGIADSCYQDDPADEAQRAREAPRKKRRSSEAQHATLDANSDNDEASTSVVTIRNGTEVQKRVRKESPSQRRRSQHSLGAHDHARSPLSPHDDLLQRGQVERHLHRLRHQLETIDSMTRESDSTIKHLLQSLRDTPTGNATLQPSAGIKGSASNGNIVWSDVAAYLPPADHCRELVQFFFEKTSIYLKMNQESTIRYDLKSLLICEEGLAPNKFAVLCTIFALADICIPQHVDMKKYETKDHHSWYTLMGDPLSTPYGAPVDNSEDRVVALALLSIYHLWNGRHDRMWECMGAAIRKGSVNGLFDERHRSWRELTDIGKEYRRRTVWYMVTFERLQAFMRGLPSALHPDDVYLCLPSFAPDHLIEQGKIDVPRIMHTYPMTLPDGRLQTHISARIPNVVKFVLVEIASVCQDFLVNFNTMAPYERYKRALQVDDLLERTLIDGLDGTGVDTTELKTIGFLPSQTLDRCHADRQIGVNLWVSHMFFFRCMIARRFLTDENAPPSLRFQCITYASGVVSTIPALTAIVRKGISPVQVTWNANHLLCAAATFAVVVLGHDSYAGIDGDPRRPYMSSANRTAFPQEQVQWLADRIFSSVECLATLAERGNATAVVAKDLLDRLCGSAEELRRLYSKRFTGTHRKMSQSPLHLDRPFSGPPLPRPRFDMTQTASRAGPYEVSGLPFSGGSRSSLSLFNDGQSSSNASNTPFYPGANTSPNAMAPTSSASSPNRISLPPLHAFQSQSGFPPPPPSSNGESSTGIGALASPPTPDPQPTIVGRLVNASSLLESVLMESPADLYSSDGSMVGLDLLDSIFCPTPAQIERVNAASAFRQSR